VLERQLDRLDGALDPGAVAAGGGEEDALDHRVIVAGRRWRERGPTARTPFCFPQNKRGSAVRGVVTAEPLPVLAVPAHATCATAVRIAQ
jgi:hypothetical protein